MTPHPREEASQHIDAALEAAGQILQDRTGGNLAVGLGVALREFKSSEHWEAVLSLGQPPRKPPANERALPPLSLNSATGLGDN